MFSYNAANLQQVAVFNTTPDTWGGATWQSGQGLAGDGTSVYFMTANGHFDGDIGGRNLSSSFIKLGAPSLNLLDWFAPYNADALDSNNEDLASAGPLIIPGTNLLVGGGKEGVFYLLNRSNMGHFRAGSNSQIVQGFQAGAGHIHGSPVYWNSGQHGPLIYLWTEDDTLKAYRFVNGLFETLPFASGSITSPDGMPGAMLSVSAAGSSPGSGIVWASLPFSGDANLQTVPGVLRAFDASNVAIELWNSKQDPRDDLGNFAKYTPPTVANGKVFLATFSNQLVVYGLNSSGPSSAPTVGSVSPNSGGTSGGTAVTIAGTNFVSGATVTFGGLAATNVTMVSGTAITATTPAHAAGFVDVTVTNPNAESGSLNNAFNYSSPTAPTVVSVSPNSGPTGGNYQCHDYRHEFRHRCHRHLWRYYRYQRHCRDSLFDHCDDSRACGWSCYRQCDQPRLTEWLADRRFHLHDWDHQLHPDRGGDSPVITHHSPGSLHGCANCGRLEHRRRGMEQQHIHRAVGRGQRREQLQPGDRLTTGTALRQSIYYAKSILGGSNTVTVTFNQATETLIFASWSTEA